MGIVTTYTLVIGKDKEINDTSPKSYPGRQRYLVHDTCGISNQWDKRNYAINCIKKSNHTLRRNKVRTQSHTIYKSSPQME